MNTSKTKMIAKRNKIPNMVVHILSNIFIHIYLFINFQNITTQYSQTSKLSQTPNHHQQKRPVSSTLYFPNKKYNRNKYNLKQIRLTSANIDTLSNSKEYRPLTSLNTQPNIDTSINQPRPFTSVNDLSKITFFRNNKGK